MPNEDGEADSLVFVRVRCVYSISANSSACRRWLSCGHVERKEKKD